MINTYLKQKKFEKACKNRSKAKNKLVEIVLCGDSMPKIKEQFKILERAHNDFMKASKELP